MAIKIKSWWDSEQILFQCESAGTVKEALLKAVEKGANLEGADLEGAYLD